jgi:transcriptional regulator with XRE-family HTH domain
MEDRDPTARAREIGLILEKAARDAGLSQADLARWLGWSQSRVSRVFSGTRPPSEKDVVALAAICRLMGEERARALQLVRDVGEQSWLQEYGERLPPETRTLINYEQAASQITCFETNRVPGLLQTPDYARALLETWITIPAAEFEDRLSARIRRQNIFSTQHRPDCHFFIDELALLRTGPGLAVMSEQLHHLLAMSVRPYITIRVIPDAVGFHPGWKPFYMMEFRQFRPVIFLEDHTSVQFLQEVGTAAAYRQLIEGLAAVALTEGQSREWMTSLAGGLGTSREEQDDLAEEHILGRAQLR